MEVKVELPDEEREEISVDLSLSKQVPLKDYICQECGENFSNYRKLGGHFSKHHAGCSFTYNHKKETRKKRAKEREALQ